MHRVKTLRRELTWFNWADSEPDIIPENYVVAFGSKNWGWGDQTDDQSAEVVCEYEVWQVNGKLKRQKSIVNLSSECDEGWHFTMYGGPTCTIRPESLKYLSFDQATAACAQLGATLRSWDPNDAIQDDAVCQKPGPLPGKFNF